MKINLTVRRSDEWVRAQRVARGVNVPHEMTVEIDPLSLSEETRRFILAANWGGEYKDHKRFYFSQDYAWQYSVGSQYGNDQPQFDGDAVTPAELDQAFREMWARLDAKREKHLAEKAEREAREKAEREAKEARAKSLAEARELLKGELDSLKSELADRKSAVGILGQFLAYVPLDAKRGALKAMVNAGAKETAEQLQERIESASTCYTVFAEDDEDEDCDE